MVLENPIDPRIQAEVDRSQKALRVSVGRPLEYRTQSLVGGHYRATFVTGLTTTLNAGDCLLSMRWANSVFRALIHKVEAYAAIRTAFGTAQELSVDLVRVGNSIAVDAGGTAITNGLTMRKSPGLGMQPSAMQVRAASATAVTAGASSVEEANAIASGAFPGLTNTLGLGSGFTLFEPEAGGQPLTLDSQEALRVRVGVTQGATGVVVYRFNVDWSEIPIELFG